MEAPSPLQSQAIYQEQFVCVANGKRRLPKSLTLSQYIRPKHISILGGIQVAPDKPLAAMGYKQIAVHVPSFEAAIRSVQGTNLVATIPRKFVAGMAYNPSIKILKPPPEIARFRYVMTWHPRLNTDAAHIWLRATMRRIGQIVQRPKG